MNRYLLDGNVLIQLVNKTPGYGLIETRLATARAHSVLLSSVSVWEMFRRAEMGKAPAKAAKAALSLLSEFNIVPFTREAAAIGGSIYATLAKAGTSIGERDSMIAGAAMAHGFIMVTDNTGEFSRVKGLSVENWRRPSPT